jgi:7-keto-8-aminopelargonate synthetase-like enzyme
MAVLAAAARALDLNRRCGEGLRARLLDNIRRFRGELARAGLQPAAGGLMPVQTLSFGPESEARAIHEGLTRAGIRALVSPNPVRSGGRVVFVITAEHGPIDIARSKAMGHNRLWARVELYSLRPLILLLDFQIYRRQKYRVAG